MGRKPSRALRSEARLGGWSLTGPSIVIGPVLQSTGLAYLLPLPLPPQGPLAEHDVVIIGGGQSALAVSYYLRRSGLSYVVLDDGTAPGGAWQHTWRSLRLFSPAQWSSLPGRLMPGGTNRYPTRDEALTYLADYETRYALPIVRPVRVSRVERAGAGLRVVTDAGAW